MFFVYLFIFYLDWNNIKDISESCSIAQCRNNNQPSPFVTEPQKDIKKCFSKGHWVVPLIVNLLLKCFLLHFSNRRNNESRFY